MTRWKMHTNKGELTMIELKDHSKRLAKELRRQSFHPYTKSNGKIYMVSDDYKFFLLATILNYKFII